MSDFPTFREVLAYHGFPVDEMDDDDFARCENSLLYERWRLGKAVYDLKRDLRRLVPPFMHGVLGIKDVDYYD